MTVIPGMARFSATSRLGDSSGLPTAGTHGRNRAQLWATELGSVGRRRMPGREGGPAKERGVAKVYRLTSPAPRSVM